MGHHRLLGNHAPINAEQERSNVKRNWRYIYGPVASWRLGASLGIDPVSQKEKVCTFDCLYCQLGKTGIFKDEPEVFTPAREIIREIETLPPLEIDFITFSGRGEPTLAANLGEMIQAIRRMFRKMNNPMKTIRFEKTVEALREFRKLYRGKLALQIMFTGDNESSATEIVRAARTICPDEVQINTPLRPCRVKPLPPESLAVLRRFFRGLTTVSVYETHHKEVRALSSDATLRRRGKSR